MKNKSSIFLLMLFVLTGLTFCDKEDPLPVLEELPISVTVVFPSFSDSVADGETSVSVKSTVTAGIYLHSFSCTGAVVFFNIYNGFDSLTITEAGVCYSTTANPTTANNKAWIDKYTTRYRGLIDGLQPATLYHIRAFFITDKGTLYGEDLSFTTRSEPVITTVGVTEIIGTNAKVTGNITSTGGSFVVARGICYDTKPNPQAYVYYPWSPINIPYIEEEVQSCDAAGEFTIPVTNLIPGTCYYVKTFVAIATGVDYGDQLIEYGNEVTFTTKP